MKRIARRSWLPLSAVLVIAIFALRLSSAPGDLRSLPAIEHPWLIAAASVVLSSTVLAYIVLWRKIIFALDPARPSFADSAAAFTCSWLGRLVPTSAPYVAGKVVLGKRLGHDGGSVAAAIVYENLFVVFVAAASSAAVLACMLNGGPPAYIWAAIAVASLAMLYAIPSSLLKGGLVRLSRFVPRGRLLGGMRLTFTDTAWVTAITLLAMALNGLAFVCVLASFVDLSMREAFVAGAAFNIAGAAGVAAVPVPSGIGVREVVLVGLLHLVVPLETAVAAALVARLITLPVDVAFGLAGAGWIALRGGRRGDWPRALTAAPPTVQR